MLAGASKHKQEVNMKSITFYETFLQCLTSDYDAGDKTLVTWLRKPEQKL